MLDATGTPTKLAESPVTARQDRYGDSPSKCPERLVDHSRTSEQGPNGIWVNDRNAVNEELMATIPNKIIKMRTLFKHSIAWNFEGQVGFICLQKNEDVEPYSCVAVTALHNIAEVKDHPTALYKVSTTLFPNFSFVVDFPEAGTRLANLTPYELYPSPECPFRGNMELMLPGVTKSSLPM